MRRMGCVFAALLFLSAVGIATLLSTLLGRAGLPLDSSRLSVLFVVAASAIAILLLTFVRVMRRVGLPLGDIVEAADRVATGDFSTRVVERGPPRLRSVARAFNSMTERLQLQEQQRRDLMADVAHELRTPLTIIQGRIEGLVDGVYPRDDQRLNELLDDTKMVARLVEDLRTLAHAESGSLSLHKEPTDMGVLIQDVVNTFSGEASAAHITMRVTAPVDLPLVDLDPLRIREVLMNIVSNAMRHTPSDGLVSISAQASSDRIVITVSDSGSGIAPEELTKIFERFYKGAASQGSGLGLTIARNLVVAHGGEITAASEPGRGTTIQFTVPLR